MAEVDKIAKGLSSVSDGVRVPQELSLGWRDEMRASKEHDNNAGSRSSQSSDLGAVRQNDPDIVELAEGFVQAAPVASVADQSLQRVPLPPRASIDVAHSPQASREATGTNDDNLRHVPPALAARNDGVPLWIDRAIVALVIVLAALLLRVLFGV